VGGVVLLLFQAVRELLFNVVKHAGTKSAEVRISKPADNHVRIEVADEGAGFDLAASSRTDESATGMGLFGLQERVAHMGGRMDVESAPGRGTRIILLVEVKPALPGAEK
jgi:signal transduction histidine kinase